MLLLLLVSVGLLARCSLPHSRVGCTTGAAAAAGRLWSVGVSLSAEWRPEAVGAGREGGLCERGGVFGGGLTGQ